jgi:hypothetical protein
MSQLPTQAENAALKAVTAQALFNSQTLEAKNKAAAKEQLLRIQLLLAKRPLK